jgi:AcrR family transcriptional regulator
MTTSDTTPPPPSREARQRETRAALVHAARTVFARAGYHGATLDDIARQAGFSKGAVYSNFDGKADLFLAVLDGNLEEVRGERWQLSSLLDVQQDGGAAALPTLEPEHQAVVRGIALATLEFIAAAMRDPELAPAVTDVATQLVDAYTGLLDEHPDDAAFDARELGTLLAALDQGLALLVLAGVAPTQGELLPRGLRRVLGLAPVTRAPDARG